MGAGIADFETGGGGPKGIGALLKGGSSGGVALGAETWVLTPRMEQALSSFQHRVARRITGGQLRRPGYGGWDYPPLYSEMSESGF